MSGKDHPRLVAVETTNRCNARCNFCPNQALSRDKGAMDEGLFRKIIDDCRAFPLFAIEPFLQGDPFSDPAILPRLEHIRQRLPSTKLRLYSNGYGMTPDQIDGMLDLGIDQLVISLNTLDAARYREVMGLRLGRTLRNLEYLTTPSRRHRVAGRITFRMTRRPDCSSEEQAAFVRYCRERGVRALIVGQFNYKGDIDSALPVPSYGCEHVHRLDILASGRVTLCCMDHDGAWGWGDVRQHSVLELYRHQVAVRYRSMHTGGRRRDIEPCNGCNYFWPAFRGAPVLEKVRTAIAYAAYVARHRPSGRTSEGVEAPGPRLVTLRRRSPAAPIDEVGSC
jgi:molybdenum cofactor biosynthesis enzyme MoaA